jgi:DNA repair protein SbcD/Mre11
VSADVFDGVDYTALGHLHGRQTISERVRYSGSPLAYSFSEADHRKGSWLVDLDGRGRVSTEFVEAPVPRPLARLRGRLDDLLADPRHAALEHAWLKVTLTDPVRPAQAMVRLRARFPHALVLDFEPDAGGDRDERSWTARVTGRDDMQVAAGFVREVRGAPADEQEQALLREAVDCCRADEGAA